MGYENNGQRQPQRRQGRAPQGQSYGYGAAERREQGNSRQQAYGYGPSRTEHPSAGAQPGNTRRPDAQPQRRQTAARRQAQAQRQAQPQRSGASRYSDQSRYASQQRQAAQTRQNVSRYNDPSRYSSAAGADKGKAPMVAAIVVILAIIAALVWFFIIPHPFEVTVNGKEVTMQPGSTTATLVEEGHVRPVPGNLVAVDGSVISTGEGEAFSATVDGKQASTDTPLAKGMVVEIDNGGDITEDYTSSEEVVPFGTVNDDTSFEAYWTGSIHALQDGQDGLQTTKTGSISGKTVSEIVKAPVDGGYRNYTVQTDEPVIALTFDDGPWPETTHEILDILEANGAKATFFTIGNQVGSYADAVQRANSLGCEVCTHTWDHADGSGQGVDLTLMSAEEQIAELTQGYGAIKGVLGVEPPHLMRAPGGNFHGEIINTLWPYLDAEIGWDVDTEDWARPGVDAIVARILSVEPGQVILMHDGGGDRTQTVEALRQALPVLVERGYKCVTVSELLTYDTSNMPAAEQPSEAMETVEIEAA